MSEQRQKNVRETSATATSQLTSEYVMAHASGNRTEACEAHRSPDYRKTAQTCINPFTTAQTVDSYWLLVCFRP